MANKKLRVEKAFINGHFVEVTLIGDLTSIAIEDNNLYPDSDSRSQRRDLNFHRMMIPLMNRKQLKEIRDVIDNVLK